MKKRNIFQRALSAVAAYNTGNSPINNSDIKEGPDAYHVSNYRHLWPVQFDGEKNLGELNPIKNYIPNYPKLRARSYQSLLESDLTETVIKRFVLWVIGTGLKPNPEPIIQVLKNEGIDLNVNEFTTSVESYYKVFSQNKAVDFSGYRTIKKLGRMAYKDAIVGGDTLVVLRYAKKGGVTIQLIDGGNVQSPLFGTTQYPLELKNGNRVENGVELSKKGAHMAYWVRTAIGEYKRIAAKGTRNDLQRAFLVYGSNYRIDDNRGMPLISVILESLSTLERYRSATVGSAEERQKIAYFIEHGTGSDGDNPFLKRIAKAHGTVEGSNENDELAPDIRGKKLADDVAASTNKTVINLTQDSSIKALEAKGELYFKEFYDTNIGLICAAIGIPVEVAMSSFNSNYSASRAAIQDWQHTLNVTRSDFDEQFYQPIYNFWLEAQVLESRVIAPGYIKAIQTGNLTVLIAYRSTRWIGASVPHIDPKKEVQAIREKLGPTMAHIPLISQNQAIEDLGNPIDSQIVNLTVSKELKDAADNGILPVEKVEEKPSEKPVDGEEEEEDDDDD